jgi:hypothetical protein
MARVRVSSYVFDPRAGTVTLNGVGSPISKYAVTSIRNTTTGETYYTMALVDQVSVSGTVFTLPRGVMVSPAHATDTLVIQFDADYTSPHVDEDGQERLAPQVHAAATDAPTTMALANDLRSKLISLGIVSA